MQKILICAAFAVLGLGAAAMPASAHETHADATYLANEAILVAQGDTKVLFDPFFPSGFGTYQEVPDDMKAAIMAGTPPFDGIDAIFVSHVHPDHFSAPDTIAYMRAHKDVHLFISAQGAKMLRDETAPDNAFFKRVQAFALEYGDTAKTITIGDITAEAVRIPHAGWPSRANVQNLVFRVTLGEGTTVMHMGDADVNDSHYKPHDSHWQARVTDHAFPPYWFFGNEEGNTILTTRINAKTATGIHVPIKVPTGLTNGPHDYFSKIGESRTITPAPKLVPKPAKDQPHE